MIEFDTFLQKIGPPEGHRQVLFSWVSKLSEWIFYILSLLSAKRSLGPKMHFFEKYPRGTSLWPSIKKSPDSNLIWYFSGQLRPLLLNTLSYNFRRTNTFCTLLWVVKYRISHCYCL